MNLYKPGHRSPPNVWPVVQATGCYHEGSQDSFDSLRTHHLCTNRYRWGGILSGFQDASGYVWCNERLIDRIPVMSHEFMGISGGRIQSLKTGFHKKPSRE